MDYEAKNFYRLEVFGKLLAVHGNAAVVDELIKDTKKIVDELFDE